MSAIYTARVATKEDPLSLRESPENGEVIERMPMGAVVDVLREGEWALVQYEGLQGYAAQRYLERIEEGEEEGQAGQAGNEETDGRRLVLTDDAGNTWIPAGGFSAVMRRVED